MIHISSLLCSTKTAKSPSPVTSLLAIATGYLCMLPYSWYSFSDSLVRVEQNLTKARSLPFSDWYSHDRNLARRQLALSSSRIIPVKICPARNYRPRWCLTNSPYRLQDFCLPDSSKPSAFFPI